MTLAVRDCPISNLNEAPGSSLGNPEAEQTLAVGMQVVFSSLPKFPTSATLLVSKSALALVAIPETICIVECPVLDSKLAKLASGFTTIPPPRLSVGGFGLVGFVGATQP